ncbi:MAG: prepilin peptidase [Actinomycetota bacterium]|nr:prepilin peptidase [Actinomycetota bacterium]
MATVAVSIILFIFGLAVGSFLNVCIWRLPRGESIISPVSHCPHCGRPIRVRDNIPLLSYLMLKGRCRYCGGRISPQYFLVELATAVLFVLVFLKHGLSWNLVSSLFFVSVLLLVAAIDLKHQIIPNKVILPAMAVQFILILSPPIYHNELKGAIPYLAGFFIGGGILLFAALVSPLIFGKEGMGGGDIKLGAFIGLTLGWHILVALFVGFLTGALVGLTLIALKRKTRKDLIPFGPSLSLGGLAALFLGPQIFSFYLGLLP